MKRIAESYEDAMEAAPRLHVTVTQKTNLGEVSNQTKTTNKLEVANKNINNHADEKNKNERNRITLRNYYDSLSESDDENELSENDSSENEEDESSESEEVNASEENESIESSEVEFMSSESEDGSNEYEEKETNEYEEISSESVSTGSDNESMQLSEDEVIVKEKKTPTGKQLI